MKKKERETLAQQGSDELVETEKQLKEASWKLRLQQATGQLEPPEVVLRAELADYSRAHPNTVNYGSGSASLMLASLPVVWWTAKAARRYELGKVRLGLIAAYLSLRLSAADRFRPLLAPGRRGLGGGGGHRDSLLEIRRGAGRRRR